MTVTHHVGDALEVARTLPDASVDLTLSAVTQFKDQP